VSGESLSRGSTAKGAKDAKEKREKLQDKRGEQREAGVGEKGKRKRG
jgi:hypothetical protein